MGQALESIVREGEAEGAGSDLVGESEGAAGRRAWMDGRERPSSPVGGRAASPISAEIFLDLRGDLSRSPRRSFLCVRGRPLARTPPRRFSRVLSARNGNAGALTFCDDGGRSTGRRCRNAGDRGSQRMSRQAPARDRRSQRAGPFSESMERREQRTPPPPPNNQ